MVAIKEKKNASTDNDKFRQHSFLIINPTRQGKAPQQKPDVIRFASGVFVVYDTKVSQREEVKKWEKWATSTLRL